MHLPNEIIFVCGQRGSGKSYWTKKLVRSLPRCIVFDSLGEYEADQRIYDLEEMVDFLIADQTNEKLFTIAYDTHLGAEDFPLFCRAILARGNVHLVIEELDLYCKPLSTDPEFLKLLKYGRHYGIQIIGVSRRPAEVSRDFTSQATRFITFGNREPRDIQYFRSVFGNEADRIKTLPQFHYLDINFSDQNPNFEIHPPI
jgi:hypothetical protein